MSDSSPDSIAAPSETSPAAPADAPRWWRNEDWLAVVAAVPLLVAVVAGWHFKPSSFKWAGAGDLPAIFSAQNLGKAGVMALVFLGVSVAALASDLGRRALRFLGGAVVVFVLAWLALLLAGQATLNALGLEYVVFALALGLLWSHTLPVPAWLREAVRTEFFIKIGIVLLGATIFFTELMKAGLPGLIQAAIVIPVVWQVCFYLSRKLKVDDEFGVMLSTAVSICGVSAAIAACGAIQGDRRKLSYVTSLVLLCAVPMMILMPWAIKWLDLSDAVGGAWLGGTLDTSGSVAAATEMVGEKATQTGMIVKMSQNVLLGVAAFWLSLWWTMRERAAKAGAATDAETAATGPALPPRSAAAVIWERFPKFVLGFLAASLVFSFVIPEDVSQTAKPAINGLRNLWFAAAFVCIGLETRLGDLLKLGNGRPALAFLGGQAFNVLWTLLLAWLLFGGVIFPAP